MKISRRDFVTMSAALLLPACVGDPTGPRTDEEPVDPRLTAVPGTPSASVSSGESSLGLGDDRDGLLYVPATYDSETPAPLFVALHGATGAAVDWRGFYDACDARGMVLLAVDSRQSTWDRIRGTFASDVAFIDAALAHTFDRVSVDPERIVLGGFSDGASYALSLGPSNGNLFRQLIAFSPGFANPTQGRVGKPRIFVSHGTNDRILPVTNSRLDIVPFFENDGYDVTYLEFDGAHEVPREIGSAALDWFLS
jgi:phospholipase/carboxylesterase